MGEYFEKVAAVSGDARAAANWVMGDLAALLKEQGKEIAESPVSAENLGRTGRLIAQGKISGKIAKEILPKMIVRRYRRTASSSAKGLHQISDTGRTREDRRRGDRRKSQTGGAVSQRQDWL